MPWGQVYSQSLLLYWYWFISQINTIGYTTYNLYFHIRSTFLIYLGSQKSKTLYISSPYLSHTLKHTTLRQQQAWLNFLDQPISDFDIKILRTWCPLNLLHPICDSWGHPLRITSLKIIDLVNSDSVNRMIAVLLLRWRISRVEENHDKILLVTPFLVQLWINGTIMTGWYNRQMSHTSSDHLCLLLLINQYLPLSLTTICVT